MGLLTAAIRTVRNAGIFNLLLGSTLTFGATLGLSSASIPETIQATYAQAGSTVTITLTIDSYSTPMPAISARAPDTIRRWSPRSPKPGPSATAPSPEPSVMT